MQYKTVSDLIYIPKGSMCSSCARQGQEFIDYCNKLPFKDYPVHKRHEDCIQVICKEYRKKDAPN